MGTCRSRNDTYGRRRVPLRLVRYGRESIASRVRNDNRAARLRDPPHTRTRKRSVRVECMVEVTDTRRAFRSAFNDIFVGLAYCPFERKQRKQRLARRVSIEPRKRGQLARHDSLSFHDGAPLLFNKVGKLIRDVDRNVQHSVDGHGRSVHDRFAARWICSQKYRWKRGGGDRKRI